MPKTLVLASLIVFSLAACDTTRESWLAGLCNDAGHQSGTAEHDACISSRAAADAHADNYFAKYHSRQ